MEIPDKVASGRSRFFRFWEYCAYDRRPFLGGHAIHSRSRTALSYDSGSAQVRCGVRAKPPGATHVFALSVSFQYRAGLLTLAGSGDRKPEVGTPCESWNSCLICRLCCPPQISDSRCLTSVEEFPPGLPALRR